MNLNPIAIGLIAVLVVGAGQFAWAQDKSAASPVESKLASEGSESNTNTTAKLVVTLGPLSPQNQQQTIITLEELIGETLENSPEILAARRRFEASTKRPSQLSTLPDPEFSVADFGVGHPFSTLNKSNFAYLGVGVSQEIPFPGKLSLRRQIAQKEADSEGQMVRDVQLRVLSRLKQAYYDLYFTHKSIEILQKNRDLLDQFAKIAEARYRVGSGLQQDVLKGQVEISLLMQRLEILEQQKESQEAYSSAC